MASYKSDGFYTITSHLVTDLAGKPYIEWRLEQRDESGKFLGYEAFGSYDFCLAAFEGRC